jgi:hypothetical protein
MTLIDIVTDALRRATVIGQTATPSAEQGQDAVTKYNDLMASLEGDGIDLGHFPKSTTADTVELPLEHLLPIKCMLVVTLCGGYGIDPPPTDAAIAQAGYNRLLRQSIYMNARETRTDNAPRGNAQGGSYNILTDS